MVSVPEVGKCYRRVWAGRPDRVSRHRWIRRIGDAGKPTIWTVGGPPGSDEWHGRTGSREQISADNFIRNYVPCVEHPHRGEQLRRRTPDEVRAYLDAHDADITRAIPDEATREDFKRDLIQSAELFAGRERIGRS